MIEMILYSPTTKRNLKVYLKPTYEEFHKIKRNSKFQKIFGLVSKSKIYIWDANDASWDDIKRQVLIEDQFYQFIVDYDNFLSGNYGIPSSMILEFSKDLKDLVYGKEN
ncbi:MAG: hypothetical protein WC284_16485 [Candidimonas sp.]